MLDTFGDPRRRPALDIATAGSADMPDTMSEYRSDRMPDRMSEKMPGRMPAYMSD